MLLLSFEALDELAIPLLLLRDLLVLACDCLLKLGQLLQELCHLLDVEGWRLLRLSNRGLRRLRKGGTGEGIIVGWILLGLAGRLDAPLDRRYVTIELRQRGVHHRVCKLGLWEAHILLTGGRDGKCLAVACRIQQVAHLLRLVLLSSQSMHLLLLLHHLLLLPLHLLLLLHHLLLLLLFCFLIDRGNE